MRRRRMHYQPSKPACILSGVVGCLFVLLGVFVIIPTFGLVGVIWTLVSAGIAIFQFSMAVGKTKMGSYTIEEEEEGRPSSAQERLTELQTLYDRRLISQEEYEAKRQEILKEL